MQLPGKVYTPEQKQEIIEGIISQYEKDPSELPDPQRPLIMMLKQFQDNSRNLASQINQLRSTIDSSTMRLRNLESQLQQEIGKEIGLLESIWTLRKREPVNRKERRSEEAQKKSNSGKPAPKSGKPARRKK